MTTHPYQNNTIQDTLVLQHRLEIAAEDQRVAYLLDPKSRFIGRITEAEEEDCYLLTSAAGDVRRVELSQVRKVKLIGTGYVRIELF